MNASSVKEGWGLTISEANSQGTPTVVYDFDGLRDSVIDGITGLICKDNSPQGLSDQINYVLTNEIVYYQLQTKALEFSRRLSVEKSYLEFVAAVNRI